MKILITGVSGLVGSTFARLAARRGHRVLGLSGSRTEPIEGVELLEALDLSADLSAFDSGMEEMAPDLILNAAATADPADCEAQPERSHVLNVLLPEKLGAAAARIGARFIHLSSEQVFDGQFPPYGRGDPPRPLHLYGRQKAESEVRTLSACPAACVVRPPLLVGNSLSGTRSPHEKMIAAWASGRTMRLYIDEIRQVASADNLAAALLELGGRPDLSGIYHWAGTEAVSRWEMGRRIARRFGVPDHLLEPIRRAETPEVSAKRPRDLTLDLAPLDRELRVKPLGFDEAVAQLALPAAFADRPPSA